MNAGLSNLATLKAWLLPASLVASTDYDAKIAQIGTGVAGLMQRYCNRSFGWAASDEFVCQANRDHVVLPRYPVKELTTVALLAEGESVWEILDLATVVNVLLDSGLVMLDAEPGGWRDKLRFTYTGGYWFETVEPDGGGYPTAQPAGSTALPADLLHAWLTQCALQFQLQDVLGTVLAEKKPATPPLAELKWAPQVEEVLRSYRRLSL